MLHKLCLNVKLLCWTVIHILHQFIINEVLTHLLNICTNRTTNLKAELHIAPIKGLGEG